MDTFGGSVAYNMLDAFSRVFIRCFIIGMGILVIPVVCQFMDYTDPILHLVSRYFDLGTETIRLFWIVFLGTTTLSMFVLFLLPFVCIKMVQRKTSEY
mgnify:CR=1 FL=1